MSSPWKLFILALVNLAGCDVFEPPSSENRIEDATPVNQSMIYEPSWIYKCSIDVGCQRSTQPRGEELSELDFTSLDVCRTICDRFGGLWPRPVSASISINTVKIHPNNLRFDLADVPPPARDLLAEMTQVISKNMLAECKGNVTDESDVPVGVFITIRSSDLRLTFDTDEEYMFDVHTKEIGVVVTISAETIYGARHALESFTQLVAPEWDLNEPHKCSLHLVAGAKIRDRPEYKYRGFLLDTSRHFIPMDGIKKMIDGMAATKMNVFHWHVTDTHSFPLEIRSVPQFTRYGAYSPEEIYTVEDVQELIKYAQVRAIRVVIEIDAPAHAGNGWQWGREFGYGDLAVCVNAKEWRYLCIQPPCGQLNPANQYVYRILENLYSDLADVLPKPALLHVGGDEVFFGCWNSSQEIINYMTGKGYGLESQGFLRLWNEFQSKALSAWDKVVKESGQPEQPVMIWSSHLTRAEHIQKYLDKNRYIIEVWDAKISPLLEQLLALGYKVVSVPKDVWYLDHGFYGTTEYSNWRRMYAHRLPNNANVLGGEVAMWTEYIDIQGLDSRVWPRAAAVAERLWSNPGSQASAAEARLERLRGRLQARGLRPDVLAPAWCEQHAKKCL